MSDVCHTFPYLFVIVINQENNVMTQQSLKDLKKNDKWSASPIYIRYSRYDILFRCIK